MASCGFVLAVVSLVSFGTVFSDVYATSDALLLTVPVSAITDDTGGFTELDWANELTIVPISDAIYAIITSSVDDGVQIIDITNPETPVPVSAITDDAGGFTELDGAHGVEVVRTSGGIYAVVTAFFDDGIQIIDITDPETPVPVSAITDDTDGFTELAGANDIAITRISDRIYAVVASFVDDGIQIIDITNPAIPIPTYAATDGVGGFTELDGAVDVVTVSMSGHTYAVVTSHTDGIQIVNITNPAVPIPIAGMTDGVGGYTSMDGLRGVAVAYIDGGIYALAAAELDSGVQIINITDPETPVPISAVTDDTDGFTMLAGADELAIAYVSGRTYAVVTGFIDDGVQIIDITNPAAPVPAAAITDDIGGFTELNGPDGIAVARIHDNTYVVVTALLDDGVQIIKLSDPILPEPAAPQDIDTGISEGGFYTRLNATIIITDYQRTEHDNNSLIRISAHITNHEDIAMTAQNHQNDYRDGEVLVLLGGTMPPPSKGAGYGDGRSIVYGDTSIQWLVSRGIDVLPQDCTSEGNWTDIRPGDTGKEGMCFWVPHNFTPDGLFLATYEVLHGDITKDLNDVVILGTNNTIYV